MTQPLASRTCRCRRIRSPTSSICTSASPKTAPSSASGSQDPLNFGRPEGERRFLAPTDVGELLDRSPTDRPGANCDFWSEASWAWTSRHVLALGLGFGDEAV